LAKASRNESIPRHPFDVHTFLLERDINNKVNSPINSAETLWEFVNDATALAELRFNDGLSLYRGQSNGTYGVNSSLYRLAQTQIDSIEALRSSKNKAHKALAEEVLSRVENEVLQEARANGIGTGLSSLETLALLQHHLSPTRLMDVSSSPLVALYFAIERNQSIDGRLFVFTIRATRSLTASLLRDERDDALPWSVAKDALGAKGWNDKVWHLPVAPLDARMRSQQGSFLAGGLFSMGPSFRQYRSFGKDIESGRQDVLSSSEFRKVCTLAINFPLRRFPGILEESEAWDAYGWSITIPKEWKEPLRLRLADAGISEDTMYPPVHEVRRLLARVAVDSAQRALADLVG